MGTIVATTPEFARLPASRALVPQTPRHLPRVEEIVATGKVLRDHEARTGFRARPDRREDRHQDPSLEPGSSRGQSPRGLPTRTPAVQSDGLPAGTPATFIAQVLGQIGDRNGDRALLEHRDGPALGSTAYRRAGGEPTLFPSEATLFRLAV